jgi:membrane associated rhomboid family serine protease
MSYPSDDDQDYPRLTPAVQALIAISVAVLFLQMTALVKYTDTAAWFGFDSGALPGRWWTVVTYMFVHGGVLHLAGNMYALFVFGPRLEHTWGQKRFLWFYLLCGLGGVVFHVLFLRHGGLVGASAAVFGVMTAYAMQWPNDEIYLFALVPVRVRTLVVTLLVFNLVMGLLVTAGSGGANIAYFAHVGGIVAAYVFMRMAASGTMDNVRQRVANLPDSDEPPRAIPRTLPRSRDRVDEVDDIVAKSKAIAAKRPAALTPGPRRHEAKAEELNRVLDKISEHGIESLTTDERRVLEDMSKKLRDA